ncbi:unnamed protein product, partial [Staurois parvus]
MSCQSAPGSTPAHMLPIHATLSVLPISAHQCSLINAH